MTHLVSEVDRRAADGRDAVRPPARLLPGRHRLRRAEGARDADHLRARGLPARPLRRRGRVRASRAATMDTCIAIRTIVLRDGVALPAGRRRHRRRLRPGRRAPGVPATSWRRSRRRSTSRRSDAVMLLLVDNYDSFTYNLAHLFEELGAEVVVRATTRSTPTRPRRSRRRTSSSPPAPAARRRGRSVELDPHGSAPRVPTLGVCLGHQAIVEAFGGEVGQAQRARARQGRARRARRQGHLRGAAGTTSRRAATTRSPRRACRTSLEVTARPRRRGDGRAPPRAADRRRPVPPGERPDAARPRDRPELPGRDDPGRARRLARRPRPDARSRRAR